MIELPSATEAQSLFESLPAEKQVFTLSPAYVAVDALREPDCRPLFFVWQEGADFWLHSLHRAKVPGQDFDDLQSAYGYGGPLSSSEDAGFLARAWAAYAGWCRDEGILVEFVRFHPLLENWRLYGGKLLDDRETVAIRLDDGDTLPGYEVRARTAVRKALKSGIEAVWLPAAENAAAFGNWYRAAMTTIGADESYFFRDDYFRALSALPGVRLLVCRSQDGEWLTAGLFLQQGKTLEYHLSGTSAKGRSFGATNLLLHAAAETGRSEGLTWLHLGGGTNSTPDNPLLFFKSGFSSRRFAFRIGYQVFQPDTYAAMKAARAARGEATGRILFYRF